MSLAVDATSENVRSDFGNAPDAGGSVFAVRPVTVMAYSFAGFQFDAGAGLQYDGRRVPLAPTEFRMLGALLAAGGRIVTKDELARRVWSGAPASDNSISRAVCAIRRALRSRGEEQIVETIYGSGFRIAVPVELVAAKWQARPELGPASHRPMVVACLASARELLARGGPADLQYVADELDRALRLLGGEAWISGAVAA